MSITLEPATPISNANSDQRRHDLDALRASAMFLGIVLHGTMSFIPAGWVVQDSQASTWAMHLVSAIHGFRMPLFFLLSGFFTAMLWRKRGLRALLVQRSKRIVLPLFVGMLTFVPLVWGVSGYVSQVDATPNAASQETENGEKGAAAAQGLALMIASLANDVPEVQKLIAEGADPNSKDDRGSTSLHIACLFGYADVANLLLDADGSPEVINADKSRPVDVLSLPWGITEFYANLLQVKVNRDQVATGREAIAARLGIIIDPKNSVATSAAVSGDWSGILWLLMGFPVFHHLWFLWFLVWLVVGFAVCVIAGSGLRMKPFPRWMTLSSWKYAWLIPLTAMLQFLMTGFGPDTSIGLIPLPTVLAYYALFFGFGAMFYEAQESVKPGDSKTAGGKPTTFAGEDAGVQTPNSTRYESSDGSIETNAVAKLLVAVGVLLPLGLSLYTSNVPSARFAAAVCSAAYAWLVSFAMIAFFSRFLSSADRRIRYLSDASYWLYLAHVPLIIYVQYLVRDWQLTAWLKLPLICLTTIAVLLLSYEWMVRYTPIGTMLNGRRERHAELTNAIRPAC